MSLTPAHDEMYLIQTHVILNEFDSCPWWDVLDTNSCNIKWVTPAHAEMYLIQTHVILNEFDSCPWWDVLDTNSCDIMSLTPAKG
jgi:hypothetical protein